jgi:hypothetical protein
MGNRMINRVIDRNKQAGMTTLTWMLVVIVAGFFLVCLVKIGPVYMESWTVKSIITQAAEEARGEGLGKAQIHERIAKKILINTVTGMTMADVEVSGQGEDMIIDAAYEVRKPLMFNIDVVLKFEDLIIAINQLD